MDSAGTAPFDRWLRRRARGEARARAEATEGGERRRRGRARGARGYGHPFGGGHLGWMGPPFGRGGPRARRGDVRAALLVLLAEGPRNGYQLMQEIERRSGGVWRPSPGSVYPALQQLEDEGLVRSSAADAKLMELTDEGRRHVAENAEALGTPWEEICDGATGDLVELRGLVAQVAAAAVQVSMAGSAHDVGAAARILVDARRALYRLLAEGADSDAEAGQ